MAVEPEYKSPNRAERMSGPEILRRRVAIDKALAERERRRREAMYKLAPPAPEPFTDPLSDALRRVAPGQFDRYRSEVEEVLAVDAPARQKSDVLARLGHQYREDFLAALMNSDEDLADLGASLGPVNLPYFADMDGGGSLTRLLTSGVAGAIRFENTFLSREWSLTPEPEQPHDSQPTDIVWEPPYIDDWGMGGGDSDDGLLSVEYSDGIGADIFWDDPYHDWMDWVSVYPDFIEPGRDVDVWADIEVNWMFVSGSVTGGNIYAVANVEVFDVPGLWGWPEEPQVGTQIDEKRMVGTQSFSAGTLGVSFIAEPVPTDAPLNLTVSGRFTSIGAETRLTVMASVSIGGFAVIGACTVKLEMTVKQIGIRVH